MKTAIALISFSIMVLAQGGKYVISQITLLEFWIKFEFHIYFWNFNTLLNYFLMQSLNCRGCLIKKFTKVLLHTAKTIDPRVKGQARDQNNRSRALKWDIVHLCSLITLRDTTSFIEIWVFQFLRFCRKVPKLLC